MSLTRNEIDNNIKVFQNLLNSTGKFYFGVYDDKLQLVQTACPILAASFVFEASGCKRYLEEYSQSYDSPLLLWSPVGLTWMAAAEKCSDGTNHVYVVGPVHNVETSLITAEKQLDKLSLPLSQKHECLSMIPTLPKISTISLTAYTLMLHHCLTGENLARSDIHYQKREISTIVSTSLPRAADRTQTWRTEQMLLSKVRGGDLNYKEDLEKAASISTGIRVDTGDMLERARINVLSITTLCIRAAIEGGLSPDLAYQRGELCIQSIMAECKTIGDVRSAFRDMYEDFIQLVRKCRTNSNISRPIKSCCDYIEIHIEEDITTSFLAKRAGYTDYYLTRKFHEEVGISIVDYIKYARIEYAKSLLAITTNTIQLISEKLHFCSSSYFTQTFKSIAGETPTEYRKKNRCV